MTFLTDFHALLYGGGNGKSSFEIFRLSTWHMLSYAMHVLDIASSISDTVAPLSASPLNLL